MDGLTGARDPQDGPSAALPGSAPAPGRRPLNLRVLFAVVSVGVAMVLVAGVSLVVRSGATYRGSATQTQNAVERLEIGGGGQIDPKDQFVLDLSTHTFTNDSSSPGNPQPVRADPAKCQQLADAYEGFSSAYDYDDVVEGRSTFFEEDSGAALSRDSPQSASTFRYASRGAAERHFDKDRADLSSCPSFTMTSDSGTVETVTRQVKDTGGLLAHSWEVTTYDSQEKYRAPSVGRYMLIGSSVVAVGWDISPGKTSTPQSRDEFERELRKSLRSRA
ncbi:hypothetical protein [Microlunatus flavus]|uniref:PknH-like extracellular domain-containing protein n=1 Tax=Microlunatus flavus TaxID=1036181 RepID=A0A1H9GFE0_9ACTN|nr:hypothetical protein [Microlunatus flavus]SEQ48753.1 hypothetical protein SAMN05421756_103612 [Microlunatus flavus]